LATDNRRRPIRRARRTKDQRTASSGRPGVVLGSPDGALRSPRLAYDSRVLVQLHGVDLPGRRFEGFEGVQVGLRVGDEVLSLFAGDAPDAHWDTEIVVREGTRGYTFSGPAVRGRRGETSLALAWLDAGGQLFRAAKLRLDRVPTTVVADALLADRRLVGTVRLTDDRGGPVCATVPDTHITWAAG